VNTAGAREKVPASGRAIELKLSPTAATWLRAVPGTGPRWAPTSLPVKSAIACQITPRTANDSLGEDDGNDDGGLPPAGDTLVRIAESQTVGVGDFHTDSFIHIKTRPPP